MKYRKVKRKRLPQNNLNVSTGNGTMSETFTSKNAKKKKKNFDDETRK